MEIKKYLSLKLETFAQKGSFNKKVIGILTSDLCWVLFIGGFFRLLYFSFLANATSLDSASYINDHSNIFKGCVNIFRTPVYPYFIKLVRLFGEQHLIRNVIVLQSIISFLTIIVFYKIACSAFINRKMILAATMVYATMLPIICFDKVIMTESFSASFIVVFIMLIVSYLRKQTVSKAIFVTLSTFFAIMLRPSFIYLLPIMAIFWIMRLIIYKKDRKMCLYGLVSSAFVVLLIHGYSSLNERENGFYGISSVTNENQLVNIVNSNMYMNGNDAELSNTINNIFGTQPAAKQHWNTLGDVLKGYKPKRISDFIFNCIKNQPNAFLKRILRTTITLQTNNIFVSSAVKKKGILPRLVIDLQFFTFYTTLNKVFIFLFFDFIFIVFRWIKTKQIPWLSMVLWLVIVAQIAVAIIGAQSDYQRLFLALIPCLILSIFFYIDRIFYAIDLNKLKANYIYI